MSNRYPSPNGAYAFVGDNYKQYGEVPGYVYYPYDDSYYIDPKSQQKYLESTGQAPKKQTLMGQVAPVVIGAGALGVGQSLAQDPSALPTKLLELPGKLIDGGQKLYSKVTSLGNASTPATNVPGAQVGVPGTGVVTAPATQVTGIGPVADGQTYANNLAADTSSIWDMNAPANGSIGQIGGGIAALKGAYDSYGGFTHGGEGLRSGLTETGAGVGQIFGGPVGAGLGAAYGNIVGYGLQGNGIKNHLALAITNPVFEAARLLGFNPIRYTTKQIQEKRWKDAGHPELAGPVDYFAGTGGEKSRDESLLTPDAIRANPDNYNAAPDWDSFSKSQQDQFLSTLLAEKKVQEKKGGIYYDDARAKELADQIRSGGAVAQPVKGAKGADKHVTPDKNAPKATEIKIEATKNPFDTKGQTIVKL